MERNDCGFLFTSAESVGLGMGMLPDEEQPFCNLWGWIVRIFYACYLVSRITYYLIFVKDDVNGRLDELWKYTGPIILDATFLLALFVNYRLGVHSGSVQEVIRLFPGALAGNPRARFARRMTQATALLWVTAIFLSVFTHASSALPEDWMEHAFVVASFYVNNLLAFGTFCFTAALLAHVAHYLVFELRKYENTLVQLYHRPPTPTVYRLVLSDFYGLRQLMLNMAVTFDGVALAWFLAASLYLLHAAAQWPLGPEGPGALAVSALRCAVLWGVLLFASDRATALRRETREIRRFLKVLVGSVADSHPDACLVLSNFRADCFSNPMALSVACGLPLTRATFGAMALLAVAVSCGAGAAFHLLARL